MLQKTISKEIVISGKGLHTNNDCTVTMCPAPVNHGIVFQRVDLEGMPKIEAVSANASEFRRNTVIQSGNASVATLEHFMATFYLLGIDNLLIKITSSEMPILEGSALPIYQEIKDNIVEQDAEKQLYKIAEHFVCKDEKSGAYIEAFPNENDSCDLNIEVTIDFVEPIGKHTVNIIIPNTSTGIPQHSDLEQTTSARTFVLVSELAFLLKNNLIKGGSIDNALVFSDVELPQEEIDNLKKLFNCKDIEITASKTLNNTPYRCANEPAYHKMLDLIGDISLLGKRISGRIVAYKPGHEINAKFTRNMSVIGIYA